VDRNLFDRRNDSDRRQVIELDYLACGNPERRHRERRAGYERRATWIKVGRWESVSHAQIGKGGVTVEDNRGHGFHDVDKFYPIEDEEDRDVK
jgi:hypothetical protein